MQLTDAEASRMMLDIAANYDKLAQLIAQSKLWGEGTGERS